MASITRSSTITDSVNSDPNNGTNGVDLGKLVSTAISPGKKPDHYPAASPWFFISTSSI